MSEDRSSNTKRSWIDRLSDVFTGEPKDKNDLLAILHDCKNNQILNEDAFGIIEGALEVQDTHVREIMIPRSHMLCLDYNDDIDCIIKEVAESAHSRYPVLGENGEDIVGILLAKDLLSLALKHHFQIDKIQLHLKDIMREVFFIPESKRLNVLLKNFVKNVITWRLSLTNMAVVV